MSKLLGIDATKTSVRVALVRTSYRKITVEHFAEASIAIHGSEAAAIRAALGTDKPPPSLGARQQPGMVTLMPDAAAIALTGERSFYRKIDLPAAAQKELDNVLAFELESMVPFEMDEAVFDYRVLSKRPGSDVVPVFAAVARAEDVKARIEPVREALHIEPARVGSGPLPLGNLTSVMPELEKPEAPGPIAILDVSDVASEIVILLDGEPVFTRTLSRGTVGLPASAPVLARELRQTLAAFRAQGGDPLSAMYLVGIGASAEGAVHFLSTELGVRIPPLPRPRIEGLTAAQAEELPRYAKALGLALGLTGRAKGLNFRKGALEAQQSFPFLRERVPLLAGLAAVIAVSFGFSTVAELRSLDAEKELLTARLGAASRDVLGEESTDPAKVRELLESGPGKEDDPLPKIDAFDVMVALSRAVPKDVVHDVIELDVSTRGHAVIQGTVPSVADAETILKSLKENKCFKDPKINKTSQFGEGKQKYVIEFDLKCEEKREKKKTPEPEGSAQPAATGKGDKAEKDGGK